MIEKVAQRHSDMSELDVEELILNIEERDRSYSMKRVFGYCLLSVPAALGIGLGCVGSALYFVRLTNAISASIPGSPYIPLPGPVELTGMAAGFSCFTAHLWFHGRELSSRDRYALYEERKRTLLNEDDRREE